MTPVAVIIPLQDSDPSMANASLYGIAILAMVSSDTPGSILVRGDSVRSVGIVRLLHDYAGECIIMHSRKVSSDTQNYPIDTLAERPKCGMTEVQHQSRPTEEENR